MAEMAENNVDGPDDPSSDKPVNIDPDGDTTGQLFLERFFQVITVVLMMIIAILFLFTSVSVAWFCCHSKTNKVAAPYDSISTEIHSEREETKR